MQAHFARMADYNAWANERVYRMAAQLPDALYRRDVGAYFKSLHGTLNHLLVADRIWLARMTGTGPAPTVLNATLYDDLAALHAARRVEDARFIELIASRTDAQLDETLTYRTTRGDPLQQPLSQVLAHVFNHQTHHRGQAHAILTILGVEEPEPLDLLFMLRERARA